MAKTELPFVVFNAEVARLQFDHAKSVGVARLAVTVALAWQLRQRDSARAQALVLEARKGLARRDCPEAWAAAQKVRLALVEAEIHWLFARMDECRRGADDALRRAEQLGDDLLLADAHWLIANLAQEVGDMALCNASLTLCAARAHALGDTQREMIAQAATARWYVARDPLGAREIWAPLFGDDEGSWPPGVTTWIYDFRASLAFTGADFGKSLIYRVRMHNDAIATGQFMRLLSARANISSAFVNLNDYGTAFQWTERYRDEAARLGWPMYIAYGLSQMGNDLAGMGRHAAARDVLVEALGMPALSTASRKRAVALDYLAQCHEALHEPQRAFELYKEMEAISIALGQLDLTFSAQKGAGRVAAALGRLDEAIELNRATLAECRRYGRSQQQIELLRSLSRLHGLRCDEAGGEDDGRKALACIEEALSISRSIEGCEIGEELYVRLAEEQARAGDWRAAFGTSLQAARAREKTLSQEAVNRSMAMHIAHETERARTEAEQQRAVTAMLQRLGDVGREITRHLDERAVFDVLRSQVDDFLAAEHLSIFLLPDDHEAPSQGGSALSLAFGVENGKALSRTLSIALDDPLSGVALCAREAREISWNRGRTTADAQWHVPGALQTTSALFAPLDIGGRVIGVMTAQAVRTQAYGERDQLVFRSLCAYGAIGLNNARAYRRLSATSEELQAARIVLTQTNVELERAHRLQQEASLTDPLTGLRNRRYLSERMAEAVALARRYVASGREDHAAAIQGLVFLMVDFDHFKSVNDGHGHAAGDRVLTQMAERLREVARESDILVRWGGEEFLVVARGIDAAQGAVLAERLRLAAASQPFDIGGGATLRGTCSVGFAAYPFDRDARRLPDWTAMVELADQALYRAKHAGRDRWIGFNAARTATSRERFEQMARDPDGAVARGALTLLAPPVAA